MFAGCAEDCDDIDTFKRSDFVKLGSRLADL